MSGTVAPTKFVTAKVAEPEGTGQRVEAERTVAEVRSEVTRESVVAWANADHVRPLNGHVRDHRDGS